MGTGMATRTALSVLTSALIGSLAYISWKKFRELRKFAGKVTLPLPDPPPEFICPITNEMMVFPVFTSDGHTYEKAAIAKWLEHHDTSPRTGQKLPDKVLRPNHALHAQIADFCQKRNLPPLPPWDHTQEATEPHRPSPVAPPKPPGPSHHRLSADAVRNGLISVLKVAPGIVSQLVQTFGLANQAPGDLAHAIMSRPDLSQMMQSLLSNQPRLMQAFNEGAVHTQSASLVLPPVVEAVRAGDVVAAEALLGGAEGLPVTAEARTLLHLAARAGDERMVAMLVRRGLQVDACDMYRTSPLHLASEYGHVACVKTLLDNGANISARGFGGVAPLHQAAASGRAEVIRLLLARGADPLCTREDGATALHLAAFCGHVDACTVLATSPDAINRQDIHGATPLYAAVAGGRAEALSLLISRGGDVLLKMKGGETLLQKAVHNPPCVRVLLKTPIDIHAARDDGWTALHFAAVQNVTESISLLLAASARMDLASKDGLTPLHSACWMQRLDAVRVLVQAGAPLEALTSNDSTPLHYACWQGNVAIATVLLDAGANLFAVTHDGDTPLHQAVFSNHAACASLLLARVPPGRKQLLLDARKRDGATALHLAAARGLQESLQLLLDAGASTAIANQGGMVPADLAAQYSHAAIAQALREHATKAVPAP